MKLQKLEKIVHFKPAFDRRDPVPSKNYGIGAMIVTMVLKEKNKATAFQFSTGMLLPETIEEYIKDKRARYELTSYGHYFLNKPMGYDVGYHASVPQFDGQKKYPEKCLWLGKRCYCDGSAMRAEKYLDVLIRKGSDEIWKMLEKDLKELR